MIKQLPNIITSMNLFSGCVGVWFAFNGNYEGAALAIFLSAIFDFLDGMVARLLQAYSEIGKELDSLADVVSFGVVPGAIAFSMLSANGFMLYAFLAFLIPVFSALRLAKFNVDERQSSSFIGLPTPANAIFWAGLALSLSQWLVSHPFILIGIIFFFSYLLVAEIPMFSLKFKNLNWKNNKAQFIFLGGCLLLILLLQQRAIAPLILWYILLSVFQNFIKKPQI
ncbi:CDP-diacylglycerol/serineO-phosphatidyltransferase [uncultured Paludibacter sp.]|nr:CDP-diacylglycerol/serineO-phosphatidyltransferase [uncultured Paludibacter sp.]